MFVKLVFEAMVSTIPSFIENLLNLEHKKIKTIFLCMDFFIVSSYTLHKYAKFSSSSWGESNAKHYKT